MESIRVLLNVEGRESVDAGEGAAASRDVDEGRRVTDGDVHTCLDPIVLVPLDRDPVRGVFTSQTDRRWPTSRSDVCESDETDADDRGTVDELGAHRQREQGSDHIGVGPVVDE